MHNTVYYCPTSALPWLAAILVAGSAHLGWFAHDVVTTARAPFEPQPELQHRVVVEVDARASANEVAVARPAPAPRCPVNATVIPAAQIDAAAALAVTCDGPHACSIRRDGLEHLLNAPGPHLLAARVVPAQRDGEPVGFKLYGLRRGSVLRSLGFRSGDLLRGINGYPLTSTVHALWGIQSIQTEQPDSFTVDLDRRGTRVVKTFELR